MRIPGFILLLLLLTSFQEEKKLQKLPPLTHTGENVLACRMNGKIIIAAEVENDLSESSTVKFNTASGGLVYITAAFSSPRYDLEISFKYNDTPGTYPIVVSYPYFGYFWDYTKGLTPNDYNQYQPDDANKGFITISYYDGKIIAGTFTLNAANRQGGIVHLTEGRFDIAKH